MVLWASGGADQAYPTLTEILLAEHEVFLAKFNGNEAQMEAEFRKLMSETTTYQSSFLAAVRLDEDDGQALLIDTGAVDGLAGDEWFAEHIKDVKKAGLGDEIKEKPTSVVVSGVGKDAQRCTKVLNVPGVLSDGSMLSFEAPNIPGSNVPALCGIQTLDAHNLAKFLQESN